MEICQYGKKCNNLKEMRPNNIHITSFLTFLKVSYLVSKSFGSLWIGITKIQIIFWTVHFQVVPTNHFHNRNSHVKDKHMKWNDIAIKWNKMTPRKIPPYMTAWKSTLTHWQEMFQASIMTNCLVIEEAEAYEVEFLHSNLIRDWIQWKLNKKLATG